MSKNNIIENRIKELKQQKPSKKGDNAATGLKKGSSAKLKPKKKKRKDTVSSLTRKLDKLFSQYIRMRDTDENGNGHCCTCDKSLHYKEGHCGHFMKRGRKTTRWNNLNCALQCPGCNTYRDGEQFKFSIYIDKLHGKGIAKAMLDRSKMDWKPGLNELRNYIEHYKKRVGELKKEKNFTIQSS